MFQNLNDISKWGDSTKLSANSPSFPTWNEPTRNRTLTSLVNETPNSILFNETNTQFHPSYTRFVYNIFVLTNKYLNQSWKGPNTSLSQIPSESTNPKPAPTQNIISALTEAKACGSRRIHILSDALEVVQAIKWSHAWIYFKRHYNSHISFLVGWILVYS